MREKRTLIHQLVLCLCWLVVIYIVGYLIGLKLILHHIPESDKAIIAKTFYHLMGSDK